MSTFMIEDWYDLELKAGKTGTGRQYFDK